MRDKRKWITCILFNCSLQLLFKFFYKNYNLFFIYIFCRAQPPSPQWLKKWTVVYKELNTLVFSRLEVVPRKLGFCWIKRLGTASSGDTRGIRGFGIWHMCTCVCVVSNWSSVNNFTWYYGGWLHLKIWSDQNSDPIVSYLISETLGKKNYSVKSIWTLNYILLVLLWYKGKLKELSDELKMKYGFI